MLIEILIVVFLLIIGFIVYKNMTKKKKNKEKYNEFTIHTPANDSHADITDCGTCNLSTCNYRLIRPSP